MTGTAAKPATGQPAAMPREGRVIHAKMEQAEPTDKQIQLAMLTALAQLAKSNGTHRGELESTVSFFV
jgi:hypothetical protein